MAKILKRDLSKEAFCENRGKYSFGEIETKSEISNSLTRTKPQACDFSRE